MILVSNQQFHFIEFSISKERCGVILTFFSAKDFTVENLELILDATQFNSHTQNFLQIAFTPGGMISFMINTS
jgi:hypothetical protein